VAGCLEFGENPAPCIELGENPAGGFEDDDAPDGGLEKGDNSRSDLFDGIVSSDGFDVGDAVGGLLDCWWARLDNCWFSSLKGLIG
jgi:hypothetical protein